MPLSAKPELYVRVDANRQIGWGHLVRSSALAQAAKKAGWRVRYVPKDSDRAAQTVMNSTLGIASSMPRLASPASWVLLDTYRTNLAEQRYFRRRGFRTLVIDDRGHGHFEADLVLNQNIDAENIHYPVDARTRLLLGTRYCLLRPAFRRRGRRPVPSVARNILVTFGGGDRAGLTSRIAGLLSTLGTKVRLLVVLGPSSPALRIRGVRCVRGVSGPQMRRFMNWSHLALTSASSTCWELAFVGVPSILLVYDDNQVRIGRGLHARGVALNLGRHEGIGDAAILEAVESIRRDPAVRRRMVREGRRIVDGRGVRRVLDAMKRLSPI